MQCDLPCYRSLSTLLEVRQIKSLLSYSTPNIFFSNTGYNKNILMYFFVVSTASGGKVAQILTSMMYTRCLIVNVTQMVP